MPPLKAEIITDSKGVYTPSNNHTPSTQQMPQHKQKLQLTPNTDNGAEELKHQGQAFRLLQHTSTALIV